MLRKNLKGNKMKSKIKNNWFVWDCNEHPPIRRIFKSLMKEKGLKLYQKETGSTHYDCVVAKNKKEALEMFQEIYSEMEIVSSEIKEWKD